MATVTLAEAQSKLSELLQQLAPGEAMTIMDRGRPVAQVTKTPETTWPCKAGSYQKPEFWMSPDFDAPLEA